MSNHDIFNLDYIDSVVRKIIDEKGIVDLRKFVDDKFSIPHDYILNSLIVQYGEIKEIATLVERELRLFKQHGFPENISTPIYEAILNAFQHGNKRDPEKEITFGYRIKESVLDILVEDEGGIIEATFIPFVLRHRQEDIKKQFINYYEFANKQKPIQNNGTGTSFIHAYMDGVRYYLGEKGLVVHMTKKRTS